MNPARTRAGEHTLTHYHSLEIDMHSRFRRALSALLIVTLTSTLFPVPGQATVETQDKVVVTAGGIIAAVAVITLVGGILKWTFDHDNIVAVVGTHDGHDCGKAGSGDGDTGWDWASKDVTDNSACGEAWASGHANDGWTSDYVNAGAVSSVKYCPHDEKNSVWSKGEAQAGNKKDWEEDQDSGKANADSIEVQIDLNFDDFAATFSAPSYGDSTGTTASYRYTLRAYDSDAPGDTLEYRFFAGIESVWDPSAGGFSTSVVGDLDPSVFTTLDGSTGEMGLRLQGYTHSASLMVPLTHDVLETSSDAETTSGSAGGYGDGCVPSGMVQAQYDPFGLPFPQMIGQPVQICGLVSRSPEMAGDGRTYLTDQESGIGFLLPPGPPVQIGDWIQVQGTLGVFHGELQIEDPFVTDLQPAGVPPQPEPLSAGEALDYFNTGRLSSVRGVVAGFLPDGFLLDDGTAQLPVFLDPQAGLDPFQFQPGQMWQVQGVLINNQGQMRLQPRGPFDAQPDVVTGIDTPRGRRDVEIAQIAPNPFNPQTVIRLSVGTARDATLVVYNARGERVRALHSGFLTQGEHSFRWNGRDDRGGEVASGLYFARLVSGDGEAQVKRMALVR